MSHPITAPKVPPSPEVRLEALESRTLLALADGFQQVKVLRVTTEVATSMEFAPDGSNRLFVVDSANRQVRVVKNGVLASAPAISFTSSEVDRSRERGINGIVFDPNFASNQYVYLYYTRPDPAAPNTSPSEAMNRLVRYRMSTSNPDLIDKSSGVVLLDNIRNLGGIHNGGAMNFGADGMLYLAIGEGGGTTASDAQDLAKPGGKVLRLNVAAIGATPSAAALAPSSNPFYNAADGITVRDYVFAYGLRNPFTGDMKPGTNTLFINDVGGSQWEEINHVQAGKNYGWPIKEGNTSDTTYTNPVYTYTHYPNGTSQPRVQAAITGGAFYSGSHFPSSYQGKYFFADYLRKWIKVLDPATKQVTDFFTDGPTDTLDVLDLDVAPDGTLWTLSVGGNIRRYSFVGQANRAPTAVASADKTSGDEPLTVNFSGAGSTDPDGDSLTYSWTFGDGTTGSGLNVQKTYNTPGTYSAVLTVSDGRGGSDASDPILITAGNRAPVGTITSPAVGATYGGGQTISFAGSATDAEDGTLAASAYQWTIVFHHDDHTHPFQGPINGVSSGSFVIPRIGEQDPDQFYRVHLKVTDSDGVTHASFRDVVPRTSTLTFNASFTGAQITLDGEPRATPFSVESVEGMTRALGAPSPQTAGGITYAFTSWSDGGGQTHNVNTPVSDTTYTASFTATGAADLFLSPRADAYIRDGSFANQNFGTATTLLVKETEISSYERVSFLRFDLTGIDLSEDQSVKLRLWGHLSDTENDNLAVGVHPAGDSSWGEATITWNNRPPILSTVLDSQTISGTSGRWYEWDVTGYARSEKAAGRNGIALAVKRGTTSRTQISFNSDEAGLNRPLLVIAGSTTTPDTTTLTTNVGSYVRGGQFADENYGGDASLLVKLTDNLTYVRESFLKFDLSQVATISGAKLRLFGKVGDSSGAAVTVGAYKSTNTSWTELGVTFNNRPMTNTGPVATATLTGTTAKWYEWDVTSFLQAEKAAGRNLVTIALKATNITVPWAEFNADVGSNRPELIVTA